MKNVQHLIDAAVKAGRVTLTEPVRLAPDPTPAVKPVTAPALFTEPSTWHLPIVAKSESNGRDWKSRSARTQAARRAVSVGLGSHLDALAPVARHYHAGGAVRVELCRTGPKRLDPANLGGALKATEDAAALMMGADDGDARWRVEFSQSAGPLYSVTLRLTVIEDI